MLAQVDRRLFGDARPAPVRDEVLLGFLPYVIEQLARGERLSSMARPILGLYHGAPGGRQFRRHLSERAHKPGAGIDVLREAIELAASWSRKTAPGRMPVAASAV